MGDMYDKLGDLLSKKILDEESSVSGEICLNGEISQTRSISECGENLICGSSSVDGKTSVSGSSSVDGKTSVSEEICLNVGKNSAIEEKILNGKISQIRSNSEYGENSVCESGPVDGKKKIQLKDILPAKEDSVGEVVKADQFTEDVPVKIISGDVTFSKNSDSE